MAFSRFAAIFMFFFFLIWKRLKKVNKNLVYGFKLDLWFFTFFSQTSSSISTSMTSKRNLKEFHFLYFHKFIDENIGNNDRVEIGVFAVACVYLWLSRRGNSDICRCTMKHENNILNIAFASFPNPIYEVRGSKTS